MIRATVIRPHSPINSGYTTYGCSVSESSADLLEPMDMLREDLKSSPDNSNNILEGCLPHVLDAAEIIKVGRRQATVARGWVNSSELTPCKNADLNNTIGKGAIDKT